MLQAAGVTDSDEVVYRAIVRRPADTLEELAAVVARSETAVHSALCRLEDLGLVRRTEGGGFDPVSPDAGLATLVQRREAELMAVRAEIIELAEDFRTGRMEAHPEGLIEVLTGTETISRRATELNNGAQIEILAFDKPPHVFRPGASELATERPLLERGVQARVIYTREAVDSPQRPGVLTQLAALGEEARVLPDLPFKLRVYDRRVAILPLTSDERSAESVVIIHQSSLLTALIALFEAFWEQAYPIVGRESDRPAELTDRDLSLLRLMSAGLKDAAIVRQLGISPRTLRRRTLHLMDLLGASTRFQAGAQAARRGWI